MQFLILTLLAGAFAANYNALSKKQSLGKKCKPLCRPNPSWNCSSSSSSSSSDSCSSSSSDDRRENCRVFKNIECRPKRDHSNKKDSDCEKKCGYRQKYIICRVNRCEKDPYKICCCYGYKTVIATDSNIQTLIKCLRKACIRSAAIGGYNDYRGKFILYSNGVIIPYIHHRNTTEYAICTRDFD